MRRTVIQSVGLLCAGALIVGAAACSQKGREQFRDAPRGETNSGAADFITFPDGFSNVAAKCDGPNRVYVAFKGDANRAALAVAANDPRCAGR